MSLLFAVGLGLILGSFLNALLFRFNTGRSVMRGRSACMRCGHELRALDLVPVVSWLLLWGKCRYCHAKISWQYPAVELAGGALAAAVFITTPEPLAFAYWLAVWMTLLFVVVYDLRHKIIPWSASLTLLAFACVGVVLTCLGYGSLGVGEWWAGLALAAPLLGLSLVSRGTWMGWGDGVLELSLGMFLGFTAGLTALMVAFWAGALVGIALLVVLRSVTMRSEVPFAPFLIVGAAVAHFLHADLFATLPLLFF